MRSPTIKDYPINLHWDSTARYYVAEVDEIPTCSADGSTPALALANLEETFAVLKEAYLEEQLAFPKPKEDTKITIETLKRFSAVVKISALAEEAGLPPDRIATKIRRSQPLKLDESRALLRAMRARGFRPTANAKKD